MSRKRFGAYKEKSKGHWHGDLGGDLPPESQHIVHGVHAAESNLETCAPGQRWCSTMEPELGLGTITKVEKRRITISFQDNACIRQYSTESAPIKRVRFQPGDTISTREGTTDTVSSLEENNGTIIYLCQQGSLPETELSDRIALITPLERLFAGHTDSSEDFILRYNALYWKSRINSSPVRGYIGGRIQLLPHQLYIANEVSSLHRKRVLLADEVGLGKTIEACLILHRLLICEHVKRVLILVPESIVNVWFVELLRKFNITFRIYDEEYHSSQLSDTDERNAFYYDQLVLGALSFFAHTEEVAQKVTETQWDLLILDEAHRLVPGSDEFTLVENLSGQCNDIMFLTATPQQHGEQNHFARLHLLDPFRYPDYDRFIDEAEHHSVIAAITGRVLDHEHITDEDKKALLTYFPDCADILASVSSSDTLTLEARKQLVAGLIDRYGIGRAMFRNTRTTVGGFPARKVAIAPLEAPKDTREQAVREYNNYGTNTESCSWHYTKDPRLEFVFELVRSMKKEKFLLICHTRGQVKHIVMALKRKTTMNITEFHEELSLLQRDRNAAWFAEEDGARLLVCSEIGSEGRNFQFAHHLIMWDVPANPELIEQRIGRLDRIGQTQTVTIHIPFIRRTPYEPLITVFNEGLDIFSTTLSGATQMFDQIRETLNPLLTGDSKTDTDYEQKLSQCIALAKKQKAIITKELEAGHDRLMEQHSFRPKEAAEIVDSIKKIEKERSFKDFTHNLYKTYGMIIEENSTNISKLWSVTATDEEFPGLSPARPFITFDRATAIAREDLEFITPDHPSVRNGIDMFLSSEKGNAALAILQSSGEQGLLLEALFVVECIAPPQLLVDRFLPPAPIRIIVNHSLEDQSDLLDRPDFEKNISPRKSLPILEKPEIKQKLLPDMHDKAAEIADVECSNLIKQAIEIMHKTVGNEVKRLTALHKVNPSITREEIEDTVNEMLELENAIIAAKPRLDGVRLILLQDSDIGKK